MANTALRRTLQSLEPGSRVWLYVLDLNPIGVAEVVPFAPHRLENGNPVVFRGVEYIPADVECEGFEYNATGAFPQPTIRVGNAKGFLSGLVFAHGDLVGATLTRMRTFRHFLDDAPSADPDAYAAPDIYTVDQKTKHNRTVIEWRLSAASDQQGVTLPRRKLTRDTCQHAYRTSKPDGSFDYTKATCPYTEARYFTETGESTADPLADSCGLRYSDCKLRFKAGTTSGSNLPFMGFPGLKRTPTA